MTKMTKNKFFLFDNVSWLYLVFAHSDRAEGPNFLLLKPVLFSLSQI